jgi:hypothetical protein
MLVKLSVYTSKVLIEAASITHETIGVQVSVGLMLKFTLVGVPTFSNFTDMLSIAVTQSK